MYYIYKYVYRNEIIYIGKTKRALSERIYEHTLEVKFLPYLSESNIFYFALQTHVEMDIYEKYLINKYMPKLNVVDKEGAIFGFDVQEPIWLSYDERQYKNTRNRKDRPLNVREQKRICLQQQLDVLENQLAELENFDAWLDFLFDLYINTGWDVRDGYVYYEWDMDMYPLPEEIVIQSEKYSCFSVSKYLGQGLYENKIAESVANKMMQQGRDSFKIQYQMIRAEILNIEYEIERL